MTTLKTAVQSNAMTTALGGAPGANDIVKFLDFTKPFTSADDLTVGGTVELGGYEVHSSCYATTESSHKVDLATAGRTISYDGRGKRWYIDSDSSVANTEVHGTGDGTLYLHGGAFVDVGLRAGNLQINADGVVTDLRLGGGNCTVYDHSTAISELLVAGGNHRIDRAATVANLYSGYCEMLDDAAAWETLRLGVGAGLRYLGTAPDTIEWAGELDLSGIEDDLDLSSASIKLFPSARIIRPPQGVNITWPGEAATGLVLVGGGPEWFN